MYLTTYVFLTDTSFVGYSENVIKPRYERGLWSFSEMLPSRETFKPIAPVSVRRNGKDMALGATTLDTVLNSPEMVTSEHPGFNGVASARALAKLAAWMANKGQSLDGGETAALMSQETWEEMHADATVNADCEIGGFRYRILPFSCTMTNHDDQRLMT